MITKSTTLGEANKEIADRLPGRLSALAEEPEFAYKLWLALGDKMEYLKFRELRVIGDGPECTGTIHCSCDGEMRDDCDNYDADEDERSLACPWCSVSVDEQDFIVHRWSHEQQQDDDLVIRFYDEDIEMDDSTSYPDNDLLTYKHKACGMPVRLPSGWTVNG